MRRKAGTPVLVASGGASRRVALDCNAFHPRKGKPVVRRRRKAMGLDLLGRLRKRSLGSRLPSCRRGGPAKKPVRPRVSPPHYRYTCPVQGLAQAGYARLAPLRFISLTVNPDPNAVAARSVHRPAPSAPPRRSRTSQPGAARRRDKGATAWSADREVVRRTGVDVQSFVNRLHCRVEFLDQTTLFCASHHLQQMDANSLCVRDAVSAGRA